MTHLWQGERIDDAALEARLGGLADAAQEALATPLDIRVLLYAAETMAHRLVHDATVRAALAASLRARALNEVEIEATLDEVAAFLGRTTLESKLERELGTADPFTMRRVDYRERVFEAWRPLGLLVHIAPTNAPAVGTLSVIEGLLSGNVNVLKTSPRDSDFAQAFFEQLAACDETQRLKHFVYVTQIGSSRTDLMRAICAGCDGVAAWGGEGAMAGARQLVPAHARLIEWGHRISFAYIAGSRLHDDTVLEPLAADICLYDQQACSSPQCVYLETADPAVLEGFAERLAAVLDRVSRTRPGARPSQAEWAEITTVTELARLDACLSRTRVIEAPDRSWRVLVDRRSSLQASPLYRSVWVKPLPRADVIGTLRPLRQYLQTVALAADLTDVQPLSTALFAAGAQRITDVGHMLDSYVGEPHDGLYALQRYTRRVSVQAGEALRGISSFGELTEPFTPPQAHVPVMGKAEFQAAHVDERHADLYFKSGGSSGQPKISIFTYHDYHEQMRGAAEGLYAAGLDPSVDRCINMFFGGEMYGGFISFFSVLEIMGAVQLPMAAVDDHAAVARAIVEHRVNVLLGMPSYVIALFESQAEVLRAYGGVRKIYFGGEHFNEKQKARLRRDFGIETIRSAVYGTVDAGPVGYQCLHATGSIHHLLARLQTLEIVRLDEDAPVADGEAGRLVFTSHHRRGQRIERYDVGDMGRWVREPCACGRLDPRFELLGRHGDVFRAGTNFLNYRKLTRIASDFCDYGGPTQVEISDGDGCDVLTVFVAADQVDTNALRAALIAHDPDVADSVRLGMALRVEAITPQAFRHTAGSGKLREVIDSRQAATR